MVALHLWLISSKLILAFNKTRIKLQTYTAVDRLSMAFFRRLLATYTCDELYNMRNAGDLTAEQLALVQRSRLSKECSPKEAFPAAATGLSIVVLGFFLYFCGAINRHIAVFFAVLGTGLIFIPLMWYYGTALGAYQTILANH